MTPHQTNRDVQKLGLMALIILSLIAIVLSVVWVIRFPDGEDHSYSGVKSNGDLSWVGFDCDLAEALLLYPLGNGVLRVSRYRISYLDINGNELFGESVELGTPICRVNGNQAVVADTQGAFYMTLTPNGKLFSANAPNTIDYAAISHGGYTVLLMDESNMKGVARISDPAGNGLFTWKSAESGYILSAEISPDSAYVDLSILNTDSAGIQPIFRRFSIRGESITQIIPPYEEIYPIILYDQEQSPVLCGQTSLLAIQGSQEKYSHQFDRIYTAASSEHGIVLVARESEYDIPFLIMIKSDGTLSDKILLSEEITPISVSNSVAAVGSGNEVVIVSLLDFQEKARIPVTAPAMRLGFSMAGNRITAVTRDGVRSLIIP
jgi:hypothetical protein